MALMIDNGEQEVTSLEKSGLGEGGLKMRKDPSLTSAGTIGRKGAGAKEWSS